jgi:hypothetical protein
VIQTLTHLSISHAEVRVGRYASLRTERFSLSDARRLTVVDGYRLRDGSIHPAKAIIIDFADGRRFRGDQDGDGGTNVRDGIMRLLIETTGLAPEHALTADEIPPLRASS